MKTHRKTKALNKFNLKIPLERSKFFQKNFVSSIGCQRTKSLKKKKNRNKVVRKELDEEKK